MARLLREYWVPGLMGVLMAGLVAAFVVLLPDAHIGWGDKANMGQFFKGLVTSITFVVFFVSLWMQVRDIPAQKEALEQTSQDMIRQTRFLEKQVQLQKEQLNQLTLQEVLVNIRVLAENVVESQAVDGAGQEVWKSKSTTDLAQASLVLLRKHAVPALHTLYNSERSILKSFAADTLAAIKGNLYGAELRGAYLEGIALDNALLVDADMRECNLRNAVLSGSNLLQAKLGDANLDGADLSGAHLIFADLHRANLLGANLVEANLMGANLDQAVLAGADLAGASMDEQWRVLMERSGAKNTDKIVWLTDLT
jgi:uncharacterized protein YjbI with pentapeptide repeats